MLKNMIEKCVHKSMMVELYLHDILLFNTYLRLVLLLYDIANQYKSVTRYSVLDKIFS